MSETPRSARTAPRHPSAGPLRPMIESWELSLLATGSAAKTVRTYTDAACRMAGWLLAPEPPSSDQPTDDQAVAIDPVRDWRDVTRHHVQVYFVWFLRFGYSKTYANNQWRALQQFFKWHAAEEAAPNPLDGLRPPRPGTKVTPVLSPDQLAALIRDAEHGRDFESRRDAAILRFLACTGCRLAEVAGPRRRPGRGGPCRVGVTRGRESL